MVWASMRSEPAGLDMLAHPDVVDALLIWRMNDPRYEDHNTRLKGVPMMRQWTIQVRADLEDPGKQELVKKFVKDAAVRLNAAVSLISDIQRPKTVCFSDDFFLGHEEIPLHVDTITEADKAHGDKVEGDTNEVSDELLAALQGK